MSNINGKVVGSAVNEGGVNKSMLMGNYAQIPIYFARGEGSYLYSEEGARYLDFSCGISVTNLGHAHLYVTKQIADQANTLIHTSNIFPNKLVEKLADRLSQHSFGGRVFFSNSGAEANEGAIKIARIYNNKVHGGKKGRILTMKNSFHGRTLATLSATGQEKIQIGFEPILDCFTYVELNNLAQLESEISKGDVGAVMLELYQGEAGMIAAEVEYVKRVRELTTKYQALMILDEVQTGCGRTGNLFAYQNPRYSVGGDFYPDIVTLAKGIANGIPMGAIIAKRQYADLLTHGTHGSTFGGNILAVSVASAVLDIILEDGFLRSVIRKGEILRKSLEKTFVPIGGIVRGEGLLIAVQLPESVQGADFIKRCLDHRLVTVGAGNNSVRFFPPLNATMDEIKDGVNIVEAVLAKHYC